MRHCRQLRLTRLFICIIVSIDIVILLVEGDVIQFTQNSENSKNGEENLNSLKEEQTSPSLNPKEDSPPESTHSKADPTRVIQNLKSENSNNGNVTEDKTVTGSFTPLDMYKNLFKEHRGVQLEAIKSIHGFEDYAKRYKMVKMMLEQLFKVVGGARLNLTEWGYLPGDPFPDNSTIRDAVSKVLENTAMFGDLVLRHPDIVHQLYDKNREWQLNMAWAVWFCNESGVFEGNSAKLLHLMQQEIDLLPKEDDYINPFREDYQKILKPQTSDSKPKSQKKKNKQRKRGPRLSGGHTEL